MPQGKIIKEGYQFNEDETDAAIGKKRLPAQFCDECLQNPTTRASFNAKYSNYLEDGHYGMSICDKDVIKYLDKEFEKETKSNPAFSYSQIKTKFGSSRIYAESDKAYEWENVVDDILTIKKTNLNELL